MWVLAGVCAVVALTALGGTASTRSSGSAPGTTSPSLSSPGGAPETGKQPRTDVGPATTALDWDSLQEGDAVPLSAFPEPVVRPKPPAAVQEKRVAKSTRSYISIPSMRVVVPIEVSPVRNGQVVVPDGGRVGWVTTSKRPGSKRGVTVLAGHLTNGPRGADAGPLFGAERLKKGDAIKINWRGKVFRFHVTHVTKHGRHELPPQLFNPNGKNRLGLTTCALPYRYNAARRAAYLSRNAIIWAERV
jgi:LPXTG-site transpeptidase (sortase) family protein